MFFMSKYNFFATIKTFFKCKKYLHKSITNCRFTLKNYLPKTVV